MGARAGLALVPNHRIEGVIDDSLQQFAQCLVIELREALEDLGEQDIAGLVRRTTT